MAFKKQPTQSVQNNAAKQEKFINQARGETSLEDSKPKLKAMNIPLPLETIERIKRYQNTEARRFETQSYIFNEAINAWLDSKGFE